MPSSPAGTQAGKFAKRAPLSGVLAPVLLAAVDPSGAAREVFQGQEYWWKRTEARTVPTSWLSSLLRELWALVGRAFTWVVELIGKLLAWLLGGLSGPISGSGPGAIVVIWLLIAALLAWSMWKLHPTILALFARAPRPPGPQDGSGVEALAEPSDLFLRAGQAFRAGVHSEAIRLALLALIAHLEKQGLLRYDTTRTNREYQAELRHHAELSRRFGQLARIHERVWYGRMPASLAEAEQAMNLCGSMLQQEGPQAG